MYAAVGSAFAALHATTDPTRAYQLPRPDAADVATATAADAATAATAALAAARTELKVAEARERLMRAEETRDLDYEEQAELVPSKDTNE